MRARIPIGRRARFETFKRDEFRCVYCGRTPPAVELQIDHFMPFSKGGAHDPSNFVTACTDCNGGKADVPLATSEVEDIKRLLAGDDGEMEAYLHFRVGLRRSLRLTTEHWGRVYGYEHSGLTMELLEYFLCALRQESLADMVECTRQQEERATARGEPSWSDPRRLATFLMLCQALIRAEKAHG